MRLGRRVPLLDERWRCGGQEEGLKPEGFASYRIWRLAHARG